jgi:hypothetical protein
MADTTIPQLTTNLVLSAENFLPLSDGNTTTKLSTNSLLGTRNRLINGSPIVWQRGTTFTNIAGNGTSTYTADRWAFSQNNSPINIITRQTGFGGRPYCIRAGKPSGSTLTEQYRLWNQIESTDCFDLANQEITLSFWLRKGSSFSGTYVWTSVTTGTGVDQAGNLAAGNNWTGQTNAIFKSFTSSELTTTGTFYKLTGTVGAGIGEMLVGFFWDTQGTASNANDYIEITGVQLERGSVATPYEHRPFAQELWMCCRYYNGGGYYRGDF